MRKQTYLWAGVVVVGLALLVIPLLVTGLFASAQGNVRIGYGETVEGEITTPGEVDTWVFDGAQGDIIALQVGRTDGILVPSITLIDPDGALLISLDWPPDGPAEFEFTASLRTSGPHSLSIRGTTSTTGNYALSLALQEAGPQAEGILAYGRVVSGEIDDATFREFWTFRGTVGDVVDATMTATGGDLDTYLSLVTPQGDVLVNSDTGGDGTDAALYVVSLPSSGTYTLAARRSGSNFGADGTTQGTYDLVLTLRRPGSEDDAPTPVALTPGTRTRGRLNADLPTALFSVEANGVLAIALDMTDPAQVGTVTVMTPARTVLNTYSGITPIRASVTLPDPGPYWIEVSADSIRESAPVDFGLRVEQITTAQRAARPLLYDRPQRVTPTSTQPETWYFDGQTGDLVTVAITPFEPTLETSTMQIIAPNGAVVATRSFRTHAAQSLVLGDSGVYEISVDPTALSAGYDIVVQQDGLGGFAFRQCAEPRIQGALPVGAANTASGTLEAGAMDAWIVDVTQAHTWQFNLSQSGADVPAVLSIEAPGGEWLGVTTTNRLTNSTSLRVFLPEAGRYRVLVSDPTGLASHTYTLQGVLSEGGALSLNTPAKGVLSSANPADWWTFQIAPGMLLNVELTILTGTGTPALHVIGPDGVLVASNTRGDQRDSLALLGVPVTDGGEFRVLVSQPSDAERMVYTIEASTVSPFPSGETAALTLADHVAEVFVTNVLPATPSPYVRLAEQITPPIQPDADFLAAADPLVLDTLMRGEVDSGQPYQAWSLTANAGQMISFSAVALTQNAAPDLILLDEEAAVIAEAFQNPSQSTANFLMHRFAEGGTYTLVIKLDDGGRYTLLAENLPALDETLPVVLPGQVLQYGDTAQGEIVRADDTQGFLFAGKGGDVIGARALRTQGNPQLTLTLLNDAGTVLVESSMIEIPPVAEITNFELPEDGIYQLIVAHGGPRAGVGGRFALYVGLTGSPVARRDGGVLDEPHIASLDANDPAHRWLFDARSGARVTIRVEPLTAGTPTPLTLQIADSAGNVFMQRDSGIGHGALGFDNVLLPRTGVYQAIVSGGRTPGVYRISLEREAGAMQEVERALRYGATVGKVLTPDNFLDVWTFAGSTGDVISAVVRPVRGEAPALSVQLRAQDGTVLGTVAGDGTGSRLENITLPFDGHYSLIVGNIDGTFEGEAAYEVTLYLEDTTARSMGTLMAYGQSVEGYFFLDDAADAWVFEGRQHDVITARVTGGIPPLLPSLKLVSTDWRAASTSGQATILASAQSEEGQPAEIEFALPETGPYALIVRDPGLVGGAYQLDLDTSTPTSTPPEAIRYGQTRTGQIGPIHLSDTWVFEGETGDAVTITVGPDSRSQLAPAIALSGPDGQIVASANATPGGTAQIDAYPIQQRGLYTLEVTRYLGAEGGPDGRYTLSVQRTAFAPEDSPETRYGTVQRGSLDDGNPADTWELVGGQAGDVIRVYAEATSGDLDPVVRVYDAQGSLLASADDGPDLNAEAFVTLPETGPYTIEAARYGSGQGLTEGNYALVVDVVYHLEPGTVERTLTYGDRVAGSVDNITRSDLWGFDGERGDTLRAKIQFPRDDAPLALFLRDSSGDALAIGERVRGDSIIDGFTLPYSGPYTLEVRRPGDAQAVHSPYALDLTLLAAPLSHIPAQGGIIMIGESVTGEFTAAPESHEWFFEGSARIGLGVTVNRLEGVLPQQIALYGPDGALVFAMQTPPGATHALSTGAIQLTKDGLYTLLIMGEAEVLGSTYRLSLRAVPSDEPVPQTITPLQDGFGAITDVNPYERWAFEAEAGATITLRVSVLGGDLEPTLMLWGPDHRPIAEGLRDQSLTRQAVVWQAVAPMTGIYEVTVGRTGGRAGTTNGEYRLLLRHGEISSRAASARDIPLGTQVSGYTPGSSVEHYAFQGESGDVVGISVRLTETGTLPDLALETEAGETLRLPVVSTADETYIPAFALPAAGRYVIVLDSQTTVGYALSAFRRNPANADTGVTRNLGRDRRFVKAVNDPARPTYWRFSGEAGDVLTFTVDTTGGGLRADMTLFGPNGYLANAVEQPGPEVTMGPVRLPQTGDYVMIVGPWLGEIGGSTGQYSVRVDTAAPGVSGSDGGHIVAWNQVVTGGLTAQDSQDSWTFDGQMGHVVTIQAEQTYGDGSNSLTLADPAGSALTAGEPATNYLGVEIERFTLPEDGIYTITVIGRLADGGSVEYRLSVQQDSTLPDGEGAAGIVREPLVGALDSAESGVQHGRVTVTAPVQAWTLTPTQPGAYLVDVAELGVGSVLDVFVLAADGSVMSDGVMNEIEHTQALARLDAGDDYVVVVSGGPALAEGRYAIRVSPASMVTRGGVIAEGESNVGRIDDAVLHNEWRVAGQADTGWTLEITSTSGDLVPQVTIVGPTGAPLQTNDGDADGTLTTTFEVPADGMYAIVVSRVGGGAGRTAGNYAITLRAG